MHELLSIIYHLIRPESGAFGSTGQQTPSFTQRACMNRLTIIAHTDSKTRAPQHTERNSTWQPEVHRFGSLAFQSAMSTTLTCVAPHVANLFTSSLNARSYRFPSSIFNDCNSSPISLICVEMATTKPWTEWSQKEVYQKAYSAKPNQMRQTRGEQTGQQMWDTLCKIRYVFVGPLRSS